MQSHFDGISMRYSFDAAGLPSARATQFYSMLGSRSHLARGLDGRHQPPHDQRLGQLRQGHLGALPHRRRPLRGARPRRSRSQTGCARWSTSGTPRPAPTRAFPLDDRGAVGDHHSPATGALAGAQPLRLSPGWPTCPSRNRSTSATAPTRSARLSTSRRPGPRACCSRTARASAGTPSTSRTTGCTTRQLRRQPRTEDRRRPRTCRPANTSSSRPRSTRTAKTPPAWRSGSLSLYHGDDKVGEGRIKTQPGKFSLAGDGLCVGRDGGEPVTEDYSGSAPWRFTGGAINRVAVDVSGEPYVDLEREAVAMMSRE